MIVEHHGDFCYETWFLEPGPSQVWKKFASLQHCLTQVELIKLLCLIKLFYYIFLNIFNISVVTASKYWFGQLNHMFSHKIMPTKFASFTCWFLIKNQNVYEP